MSRQEKTALFPASFDPITNGHVDSALRAVRLFDRLVVAVAVNVAKAGTFSLEERLEMVSHAFQGDPAIEIRSFEGLTVDYAQEIGARAIIRGVRAMSDFEYEFEMALMNKHLFADVETVFMMPSQQFMFVSSSRLKELVRFGRDVEEFVPAEVAKQLRERLGRA
jgi:pantetheine-phosphate adenylyltransferase